MRAVAHLLAYLNRATCTVGLHDDRPVHLTFVEDHRRLARAQVPTLIAPRQATHYLLVNDGPPRTWEVWKP